MEFVLFMAKYPRILAIKKALYPLSKYNKYAQKYGVKSSKEA